MSRDAKAGLVAAAFGLVFVLVNAGALPSPYALVVRVVGLAGFLGVVAALLRSRTGTPLAKVGPRAYRLYWIAVVSEGVAIVGGSYLLRRADFGELGLPWVVTVIGAHFVPLAWAFRAPFFHALGAVLVALGMAGGAFAIAGAGSAVVAFVSGVGAGMALLAFAARPALVRSASDRPDRVLDAHRPTVSQELVLRARDLRGVGRTTSTGHGA